MGDGLTGNITASPEAASAVHFLVCFSQLSTFGSHLKYITLRLSSGGSSEPVKDMVEKKAGTLRGQLSGRVCSRDADPLHCRDEPVLLCVC